MNYIYNLFNPLDYLRLLFLFFFNINEHDISLLMPENDLGVVILNIQLDIVVIIIIIGGVLISLWSKNWILFFVGLTGYLMVRKWRSERSDFNIAGSMVVGVVSSLVSGLLIMIGIWMTIGIIGLGKLGRILGLVISGFLPLVVLGWWISILLSDMAQKIFDDTFIGPVPLMLLILLLRFINKFINWRIINSKHFHTAVAELLLGLIMLALLSLGTGYLFATLSITLNEIFKLKQIEIGISPTLSARVLPVLNALHSPIWTAAFIFLFCSRLFLWPLEVIIGLIGYVIGMRSEREPYNLLESIKSWYFDHDIFLPLPGESLALRQLAALDWNMGIKETINIAQYSGHLLGSISALRTFAFIDPYGVQGHLNESVNIILMRFRLLQLISHNQPQNIHNALFAYLTLNELGARLSGSPPFSSMLFSEGTSAYLPGDLSSDIEHALTHLNRILRAMQLAKEGEIRYSEEIIALYGVLMDALSWSEISQIANFRAPALPFADAPHLFPSSLAKALTNMNAFAQAIVFFNQSTSLVTKQQALLLANGQLASLEEQINEVPQPAGPILAFVLAHWQNLLATTGGAMACAQSIGPVANPYVIGNPVTGSLFVGRDDILRRLEELWTGEGQKPSILLYGHRRMGKSSILHNLGARFGPNTTIVDFNMQRVGLVSSTGELLYNQALALYDGLHQGQNGLQVPDEELFIDHNPYTAFDRFLKQIDCRRGHQIIITVDEFELIEQGMKSGQLEPELLTFWRGLIQTYPWFVMAFAGLHTIQEMTQDYWNPFYGSVTAIPVSFLAYNSAKRLITQPTPDFSIDYDMDAVERIFTLTNGQPYLMQLIGHGLVTRFNRQTFEDGLERERRFTLTDVEQVINTPEFYRDGDAYFTGIWRQTETDKQPWQVAVLQVLSETEFGMVFEDIYRQARLTPDEIELALQTLSHRDIIIKRGDLWHFPVELMRRWVMKRKAG